MNYFTKRRMTKSFHPTFGNYYWMNGEIYSKRENKPVEGSVVNGEMKFSIHQKGSTPIKYPMLRFIWEAYNDDELTQFYKVDGHKFNTEPDNLKVVFKGGPNPGAVVRSIIATILETGKKKLDFLQFIKQVKFKY